MYSDAAYTLLVVAFLASRACDLQAVRAKMILTLRSAKPHQVAALSPRVRWLFRACSWLRREIPYIAAFGLLLIVLIFGNAAIAEAQNHTLAHQLTLALAVALAAVTVSIMGAMVETLRNELDRALR